jgi:hypothetical protein
VHCSNIDGYKGEEFFFALQSDYNKKIIANNSNHCKITKLNEQLDRTSLPLAALS